jgi:hypothetical protein
MDQHMRAAFRDAFRDDAAKTVGRAGNQDGFAFDIHWLLRGRPKAS